MISGPHVGPKSLILAYFGSILAYFGPLSLPRVVFVCSGAAPVCFQVVASAFDVYINNITVISHFLCSFWAHVGPK